LIAKTKGILEEKVIDEIEKHYNGYKYNIKAKNTLYNAFAIQNYFKNEGDLRNYFAESGGTKILLRSLNMQDIPDLRKYLDLLSNQSARVSIFRTELTTPKDWAKLQKDFKQNAFDAGYLTIDGLISSETIALKVPNHEVFQNMKGLLRDFLCKKDQFGDILQSLIQKRFKDFFQAIEEVAFRDKTFLNIADKNPRIKQDANYEPLLHTILLMAIRMTVETGKENQVITNFTIKNRKKPDIGRKRIFFIFIYEMKLGYFDSHRSLPRN